MAEGSQGYSQQQPSDNSDEFSSRQFHIEQVLARVSTMKVAKVIAVDTDAGTVDVQPMVSQVDGMNNVTPHGTVYGLPYVRSQGGNSAIVIDPVVGDIGMMAVADRDISAVKSSKQVSPPGSGRRFSLADGVYLGGFLNSNPTNKLKFTDQEAQLNGFNVDKDTQHVTTPVVNFDGNTKIGPAGPTQVDVGAHKYLDASQSGVVQSVGGTFLPIAAGALRSVLTQLAGGTYGFQPIANSVGLNILDYGGVDDGVTDNTAAFDAAWNALRPNAGGCILFPVSSTGIGKYAFSTSIDKTLSGTHFRVVLMGVGNNLTQMYWPGGSGGMHFTYGSDQHSVSLCDMAFLTGAANGGNALSFSGAGFGAFFSTPTDIRNVSFLPNDAGFAGSFYWTRCVYVDCVSNINFYGCMFIGKWAAPGSYGALGYGVEVTGDVGSGNYAVLIKFVSCTWQTTSFNFVYGPYVQGVKFIACDFNGQGSQAGIFTGGSYPAGSILADLTIIGCQFDTGLHDVYLTTIVAQVSISSSIFTLGAAGSGGIDLQGSFSTTITGCSFNLDSLVGASAVFGIGIGPPGDAIITSNVFLMNAASTGYIWGSGTDHCQGAMNSFVTIGTAYSNGGSSLTPGTGGTPAHP